MKTRVVRIEVGPWARRLDRPVRNARRTWSWRRGILLRLEDDGGRLGVGEASPLPGYSPDRLGACAVALRRLEPAALVIERGQPAAAQVRALLELIDPALPAARFALETALLDLLDAPVAPGALPVLVRDAEEAAAAVAAGARCVKLKIGGAGDVAPAARVRAAIGPDVALRLDANGALPVAEARAVLTALAPLRPEWIEEPVPLAQLDAVLPAPVPIAIDESLIAAGGVDDALARMRRGEVAALILKPTLLGGRLRCAELAAMATAAGGRSTASHCFEGPIGEPPTLPSPRRGEGSATPSPRRGEGQGGGLALIDGVRRYSRAEIDARIAIEQRALRRQGARRGLPFPVVAAHRIETAVQLFALWELGAVALLLDPAASAAERAERVADAAHLRANEPGAIVFTSGSTGRPRAVLLPWSALTASAAASAANLGWRADDRWLCCLPLHHVGGLSILVRTLLARRAAVLAPPGSDGAALAHLIHEHGITLASLVPTQLSRLIDATGRPPPHLRAILVGGAAAARPLLRRALDQGLPILRTYGMTETASQICTDPPGEPPDLDAGIPPLPGVALALDAAGRIRVHGPMVCAPGAGGWLTTTDLGELDGRGALRVRGRVDDIIVTGGEKVDPLEVEAALLELPGIDAACVFGLPDPQWGHIVAAALVGATDPDAAADDDDALRAAIAARLTGARRPRRICRLPALALGPGGKLDRRATARAAARLLRPV